MEEKPEETEQIQKPKKARSEKHIEAFNKARAIRTEKSLLKKQKIKEVKDTINTTPIQHLKREKLAEVKPKKQPKIVQPPPEESSEEEEEEISIRKNQKNQRKKQLLTRRVQVRKNRSHQSPSGKRNHLNLGKL